MSDIDLSRVLAKGFFCGLMNESLAFPYPRLDATEAGALLQILDSIRRFAASHIDSRAIDEQARIPEALLAGLKDLGLFGMVIPEAYGGGGLGARMFCRVIQELASFDASVALTVGAHQTVGMHCLLTHGTEEQKQRYLPRLASGEWIAAFGLTESDAGSDAAALATRAEPAEEGRYYVLNGRKQWVTNGGLANLYTVFAKLPQESSGRKRDRITAFLVERGLGVVPGPEERKLGIRGSSATSLVLDGARVPRENILGTPGQGFAMAQEALAFGRLSLAAGCVGVAQAVVRLALEHARGRRQFGKPIADFDMIRAKFGKIATDIFAAESMVYLTAGLLDAGTDDYAVEAACCKVFASEMLWHATDQALQICGGYAYMSEYPYERYLRDARINLIFNGTNEILRLAISLGGMAAPGERIARLPQAIRRPVSSYEFLAEVALTKLRSTLYGERLSRAHPLLRREADVLEDYVIELEQVVERFLKKHGGRIVELQHVHRRVADAVIDMYALLACLSRTTALLEQMRPTNPDTIVLPCRTFAQAARERLRQNLCKMETREDERLSEMAEWLYERGGTWQEPLLGETPQ